MKRILRIGEGYAFSKIYSSLLAVATIMCLYAVKQVSAQEAEPAETAISGIVTSASSGEPLEGASVSISNTNQSTRTDRLGGFTIITGLHNGTFKISHVGYETRTIDFGPETYGPFEITLATSGNVIDEVQVIGYGQVSKRFNTGSVVTVTSEEIERQPVSNPLAALAGRVPGMTVTQTSGNPGSKFEVQIRGRNSISQGSEPLFLIDGVPYPNDYVGAGFGTVMGNGGQNAFANINPLDIESIEVLKDADATAIYGSRGANGVVLITTKKGKAGQTKIDVLFNQGWGGVPNRLDLLNTRQYVAMRKEAFVNDGIEPTAMNAPDLVLWDTTRYTDWQEELIGGTAQYTNANISLSGGTAQTRFVASGNYNRQTTVNPGDFAERRGGATLNLNHASNSQRFYANVSVNYSSNKNALPYGLVSFITMPPNTPALLDDAGQLVWSENGGTFSNPLAYIFKTHETVSDNLAGSANLSYEVLDGLTLKATGGYTFINFNEKELNPLSSQDPNSFTYRSSTRLGNAVTRNWIIEPQVLYDRTFGRGTLSALAGATFQENTRNRSVINATGFPNDELLEATAFAASVTTQSSLTEYRYQALFARVNYNLGGKYIVNLTGRRDGSSRFGPNRRVANFGAVGAAWIFSEELKHMPQMAWLSFGKLRASYGVTGNDQIGDYQYLDDYRAARTPYQGQLGYLPSRLYNPDYSWERNRKIEAALELGAADNRVLATVNWFRNRSDNQLINYTLPNQTGFSSIFRNFGASVQNAGWEIALSGMPVKGNDFAWEVGGNVTFNRNKLLAFPGLETSSYANTLILGQPLDILRRFRMTGIDPETGLYTFQGTTAPADQTFIVDMNPKYYGGINNQIRYKGFDFSFFFQLVSQKRLLFVNDAPGTKQNQLTSVLDRWQETDRTGTQQRFTTTGAGLTAFRNFIGSDGQVTDGSFVRLKNVYLSYTVSKIPIGIPAIKSMRLFVQGQNLLTFTGFNGLDPETQGTAIPPLRMMAFGIHLSI